MQRNLWISGFLLLAVLLVFGQTLRHKFVNFDDDKYIVDNPHVAKGITGESLVWAFTSRDASNWHPLTWLSHLLDCRLYGLSPRGHHLTNVLLHAAAAIVLFFALQRMTGDCWPSAFVAAFFALHPLRAESVAWIAERKDVLSGLLFMLTLTAYLGYVRRPFSPARYLLVVACFTLGLMAKPMLVTLPFVLLLLDYWPLNRFHQRLRVIVEKLPLLALSIASCVVTLWAQQETIAASRQATFFDRFGNAAVSYVIYLRQFLWPTDLAVLYPHPGTSLASWKIAASVLLLTSITAGVVLLRRRAPYLLVGWLWYLGMMLPVIGLIQVGYQAMADRYTYLPQIGLCIAVAWAAKEAAGNVAWRRHALGIAATVALTAFAVVAWRQTSYWQNSETLWTHTLACTERNAVAHYNFGVALADWSRVDEAVEQYKHAIEVNPDYAEARYNLAVLINHQGQVDEAIEQYRKVLKIAPDSSDAHLNLGAALARQGHDDEAIEHYREALRILPQSADAHNNLANALVRRKSFDEAIRHYESALRFDPNYVAAHFSLANLLADRGDFSGAISHYRIVLQIDPSRQDAEQNLEMATQRLQKSQ
jgi:protein O-mannosyl-transferase